MVDFDPDKLSFYDIFFQCKLKKIYPKLMKNAENADKIVKMIDKIHKANIECEDRDLDDSEGTMGCIDDLIQLNYFLENPVYGIINYSKNKKTVYFKV